MKKLPAPKTNRKRRSAKSQLCKVIKRVAAQYDTHEITGFLPSMLVLTTLPHRKTEKLIHTRVNGDLTLDIVAHPTYGLPYGTYPRIILMHVCKEVVRTGSGTVDLGHGITQAMGGLDLDVTGGAKGTINVFRGQLAALCGMSVHWTWRHERIIRQERYFPIRSNIWNRTAADTMCRIELDAKFVEELQTHAVPMDITRMQRIALEHGPFPLDIGAWLPYRLRSVVEEERVGWPQLRGQFGADYSTEKNFRAAFMAGLEVVRVEYPFANVDTYRGGLLLLPSPRVTSR